VPCVVGDAIPGALAVDLRQLRCALRKEIQPRSDATWDRSPRGERGAPGEPRRKKGREGGGGDNPRQKKKRAALQGMLPKGAAPRGLCVFGFC
jgi:hypothetical protein